MAVNPVGSAFSAAQLQALRQAPQGEQVAAATVATANQVNPEQVGQTEQNDPAKDDATRQAVTAAHLGAHVDEEA